MKKGILYLIPALLGSKAPISGVSSFAVQVINSVDIILAERPKTTRAFFKRLSLEKPISELDIQLLNIHTKNREILYYLSLLEKGQNVAIIPEAGCPGIADPGANLVRVAHEQGIIVKPLIGPCSIVLSLMASGFNGQNFTFIGYLPKTKEKRIRKIAEIERLSQKNKQTQIFIETPYRAHYVFEDLVSTLRQDTELSLAIDLTLPTELIVTKKICQFRQMRENISLENRYVVFLVYRGLR